MAEVPVTLEGLELQLMKYKEEDLMKKMNIAANVLKKCSQVQFLNVNCHVTKANLLTGVPRHTVQQISAMEQKRKKFDDWIRDRNIPTRFQSAYRNLRELLVNKYTTQFIVPTNLDNVKTAHKQFCISLQIPGTKNSITVEKPETVMERQRFLYTKMTHREAGRHIVYIGKINLFSYRGKFSFKEDIADTKSRFVIAASPTLGYLSYFFCGARQEYLLNWIKDKIEPELPKESVIIFQENVLGQPETIIDSHSSKEQMIKWLESKDILHEPKMHRAELFRLIERYKATNIDDVTGVEGILKARGHIPIRKKKCNLEINYFDPFWYFLIHELNSDHTQRRTIYNNRDLIRETANMIIENAAVDYWSGLDDILIEKEGQIYREDLELEHIIDKLMTMAKNEGLPDDVKQQKLDEYSKQLEEDHFFIDDSLIPIIFQTKVSEEELLKKSV